MGVSLPDGDEAIRAGAAAVGVGDEMVPGDALTRRDFAEITRRARLSRRSSAPEGRWGVRGSPSGPSRARMSDRRE
jgi:hypothetical protein